MRIYKVGGCVRDQFLGHKPNDIDYCMEAESYEIMLQYLRENNFQIIHENKKCLTIKVKFPENRKTNKANRNSGIPYPKQIPVDFTLCRKDGVYSDHRRPDSVEVGTIYDDLARRDFTINAMAIDEVTGELIDPYGGKTDLDNKIIRCVGSVKERLCEDPLRIVRALRFAITKGFIIDDAICNLIWDDQGVDNTTVVKLLEGISSNRIRDELFKMFSHDTIATMILLSSLPKSIQEVLFKEIWLKPTSRTIK